MYESITGEATNWLDLVFDHAGGFGGLDSTQVLRSKPHHGGKELEAQAAHHALGEYALEKVDAVLEGTIQKHEEEEEEA